MKVWWVVAAPIAFLFGIILMAEDQMSGVSTTYIALFFSHSGAGIFMSILFCCLLCGIAYIGLRAYREVSGYGGISDMAIFCIWIVPILYIFAGLCQLGVDVDFTGGKADTLGEGVGQAGKALSKGLGQIFGMIFIYLLSIPFFWFVLILVPFFLLGVHHFIPTMSRSASIAGKQFQSKKPSDVLEAELADAMASGAMDDYELRQIIDQMSPLSRFFHIMTYQRKAEKYRQMKEVLDAQARASRARNNMGKSAHESERAKRS